MDPKALLHDFNGAYGLDLREVPTIKQLEEVLAERVAILIDKDFSALVRLLYRVDVDETKLRQLLRENMTMDAGLLIARLILESQWQKILPRRQYSRGGGQNPV